MSEFNEIAEGVQGKFAEVLKTIFLMVAGIIVIKVLGLDHLYMEEYFPRYFRWLTVSKVLAVSIAFILMRYGWSRPDRGAAKISEGMLVFYEGTTRVIGALIVIIALSTPFKVLVGYFLPRFVGLLVLLWLLLWIVVLFLSVRKDRYNKVMGDMLTSKGAQGMILEIIRFVVMLPVKIFRRK